MINAILLAAKTAHLDRLLSPFVRDADRPAVIARLVASAVPFPHVEPVTMQDAETMTCAFRDGQQAVDARLAMAVLGRLMTSLQRRAHTLGMPIDVPAEGELCVDLQWPADVAPNDLAEWLRGHAPDSHAAAPLVERIATGFTHSIRILADDVSATSVDFLIVLTAIAFSAWRAIALNRPFRAPSPFLSIMVNARAGAHSPVVVAASRDLSGRTFATPTCEFWDLRVGLPFERGKNRHGQLVLPMPYDVKLTGDNVLPHVRQVITPSVLRAVGAVCLLAEEHDNEGAFTIDVRHLLLDVFGLKPESAGVKRRDGSQYERPPRGAERAWTTDLGRVLATRIHSIAGLVPDAPTKFVTEYSANTDGRKVGYQLDPIVWKMIRGEGGPKAYTSIPRAVLRLDAHGRDLPLAFGLANVWRARITKHVLLGPGYYATTARELAEEIGEDWRAGVERNGPGVYWSRFVADVQRVARAGELGVLTAGAGAGGCELLTLEPTTTLATIYRPLADAVARHAEINREAKVRSAAKQLRGHPRKPIKPDV